MKSIQKTIFKAMDVEGKGKLEVKDLRTYMDFVKDPYNIIRTFAQRYNYMKISQEEYMDAVNTYVENHGTPRKCHIEDVREVRKLPIARLSEFSQHTNRCIRRHFLFPKLRTHPGSHPDLR